MVYWQVTGIDNPLKERPRGTRTLEKFLHGRFGMERRTFGCHLDEGWFWGQVQYEARGREVWNLPLMLRTRLCGETPKPE